MANDSYRALVVDDEPAVRNLAIRALQHEGFSCDSAADGLEAENLISTRRYDVVVTDLRMPNKNGHAVALNLLLRKNRPVVVILTGVLEPKIAKDMTARGVDCIEFKPVNYLLFAAKVKGLVEGRKLHSDAGALESSSIPQLSEMARSIPSSLKIERTMVRKKDIEGKLTQLTRILPISGVAFDIFNMASTDNYDNFQIAAAVGRDATLSVDILRLANSSFYNYSHKKVVNLVKAVSRIGQKRVGELALTTSMMVALTPSVLPWMDIDLTWHRSMAASVAIDHLSGKMGIPQKENRLFLSSISYPLGRIALCMLYPGKYQEMIKICQETQQSLKDLERLYFSMSPEEVMGFLFKAWNIPPLLYEPLVASTQAYGSMGTLAEPLAMKVELLKIAILIAEIAVGRWESWDRIEFPPGPLMDRLEIESFTEIIEKTRTDYRELIQFREANRQPWEQMQAPEEQDRLPRSVFYCNLMSDSFDFLDAILSCSGFELRKCNLDSPQPDEAIIVNCIGVPPHRLVSRLKTTCSNPNMLIVTDSGQTENLSRFGQVFAIPASHGSLQKACNGILNRSAQPAVSF